MIMTPILDFAEPHADMMSNQKFSHLLMLSIPVLLPKPLSCDTLSNAF